MSTLSICRGPTRVQPKLIHAARKSQRITSRCLTSKPPPDPHHPVTSLPKPRLNYRDMAVNVVYKSHNAFNRKAPLPIGSIQAIPRLYAEQKAISKRLDEKRRCRSTIGERIRLAAKDPTEKHLALEEAKSLKEEVATLELKLEEVEEELFRVALGVPNDTHPEVPIGPESAATVLSHYGPEPLPAFPHRDHVAVATALELVDFEAGAAVSGTSWYYLMNEGALLEMALTNYAMSIAIKHGFMPVTTPDVVRADIASRCGFQPRDEQLDSPVSQMYHINHYLPELVLAGTAEIPLAGMFANQILSEDKLPVKVVGLGRAFRAEAGARGTDTRGLYRVHQFTKLELFAVSSEAHSEAVMEDLKTIQLEIFNGLGLPFRVLDMPTEELGASAYRKYDIEAWMPGRGSWGEISSTSNCTDYQSRRLHIRYRCKGETGLPFAHTLNGTAAAIPRLIVALIENGVRFDGAGNAIGLDLPRVLQPFWVQGGRRDLIRWV
ncbi:seryl-tRNA synthetase [Cristinia sonorae]|uniref:serine--tRNA ligase n=1 Tax=Cristinia sonorae TaxID=1940300 RepID=A0A8K0UL18_9AGAR|nr:seryl-tRNA synthetase [Cristinia sonorae]